MAVTTEAAALEAARTICDRYAPDAPVNVLEVAAARLAAIIRLPPGVRQMGLSGQQLTYEIQGGHDALRRSGAAGLLSPWRVPRARPVGKPTS